MLSFSTITGELLMFGGILASLFLGGVFAATVKAKSKHSVSKWAFQPATVSNTQQSVGTPIDILAKQPLEQVSVQAFETPTQPVPTEVPLMAFETSDIEANDDLINSIDELLAETTMEPIYDNELQLSKERAAFLVGETVADLITATLENLPKEKAVIFGRFVQATNEIEMNGYHLKLSYSEEMNLADEDLMLVKGQMLPNGEFRVLHWDDAENVEAGYGVEDFQIQLVS